MARYIADQNKVVILQESGTYAVATADVKWPGEVTENSITENEGKLEDRYLGNASRSYGNMQDGPVDINGTTTANMNDSFFLAHALGSVQEISGTTFRYISSEVNSDVLQNPFISGTSKSTTLPFSFTLEDSKQAVGTGKNFIRLAKGCVIDTCTVNLEQGGKVTADVGWMAQSVEFKSGATTSLTVPGGRPYLWSDCTLTMFGSVIDKSKSISFEIANNVTPPHYVNGSRYIAEPFLGNRNYTLTVTGDLDADLTKAIYTEFCQGGSTFNATLDLDNDITAVGSQHLQIVMSGCEITGYDTPSVVEGVNEQTLDIRPKNVSISEWVNPDNVGSFNPY